MDEGGWVLLGHRDQDEIAFGLVDKFWRPVIEFARVTVLVNGLLEVTREVAEAHAVERV